MEHRVRATIVSCARPCPHGHRVGQEWDLSEGAPGDLCHWAYNSLYPFYCVLRYGGRFPWQREEGPVEVSCPDPDNAQRIRLEIVPD